MTDNQTSKLDAAKGALENLGEDADRDAILAAIHRRLTIDRDVRSAELTVDARSEAQSGWSDWLGCALPIVLLPAFFLAIPLLFSLGERIVSRPARTISTGIISQIEYVDGKADVELVGQTCKVTSSHLIVKTEDGMDVLIPNAAYRKLTLDEKSD